MKKEAFNSAKNLKKIRLLGNKSAKSKNSKLPRRTENPKSTLTTPRDKTWVRPPPSVKSDMVTTHQKSRVSNWVQNVHQVFFHFKIKIISLKS